MALQNPNYSSGHPDNGSPVYPSPAPCSDAAFLNGSGYSHGLSSSTPGGRGFSDGSGNGFCRLSDTLYNA